MARFTGAGIGGTGISSDAFQGEYHDATLASHVFPCGDRSGIEIIIEGIRCATCVSLNEKIIGNCREWSISG